MGKTSWLLFFVFSFLLANQGPCFLSFVFFYTFVLVWGFFLFFLGLADTSLALFRLLHSYAHNRGRLRRSSAMVADKVMLYLVYGVTEERLSAAAALQLLCGDSAYATYEQDYTVLVFI